MKSEFVSVASHQLRTPLSVIKWILKLCIDGDLGGVTSEQKDFLEKAYMSNQRMINLVNDLLDVSRIEEGRFGYHFTTFDFIVLLKEILDEYKILVFQKGIELTTNVESAGDIVICADRERLSLVFSNLIDNAVKFTPRKGRIRVLLSQKKGTIIIEVGDTGIGIGEADKERLFSKFFRAENALQMQTEGTGLGLFIAKNIIEKHRGSIRVDTTLGKGTVVTCILPST
jgi:signal transduction histidine kinase